MEVRVLFLTGCDLAKFQEQSPCESLEEAARTDCEAIVDVLDGLRWDMPCAEEDPGNSCGAEVDTLSDTEVLDGTSGALYDVTLRFRGVVEQHTYSGGEQDEYWYVGGASAQSTFNIYGLSVSSPEGTYFLNAGESGIYNCYALDYERTLQIDAGAEVSLTADAQDGTLISNHDEAGDPIVVPDVEPYPDAYNGQFIQMDVVAVVAAG